MAARPVPYKCSRSEKVIARVFVVAVCCDVISHLLERFIQSSSEQCKQKQHQRRLTEVMYLLWKTAGLTSKNQHRTVRDILLCEALGLGSVYVSDLAETLGSGLIISYRRGCRSDAGTLQLCKSNSTVSSYSQTT